MSNKPATIFLPDGYNGHTVECLAEPVFIGRSILKLQVYGKPYIRWCHRITYEQALRSQSVSYVPEVQS